MRGIRAIVKQFGEINQLNIELDEFDVRLKSQCTWFNLWYIYKFRRSQSPLKLEGSEWEKKYFEWLGEMKNGMRMRYSCKKNMLILYLPFFFQLVCGHWQLATVCAEINPHVWCVSIHLFRRRRKSLYLVEWTILSIRWTAATARWLNQNECVV